MTNWRCSHAELHRVSTIGCMYTACAVCARIAAPCVRLYGRFPGMRSGLLQNRIVIFGPLARCFSLGFRRVSVLTLALSIWAFRRLCPSCHASLSVRTPADFHRRERPLCAELLRDTRTAALCTDALALRKACRAVRQSSQTALVFPSRQNRSVQPFRKLRLCVFPHRQIMGSLHRLSFFAHSPSCRLCEQIALRVVFRARLTRGLPSPYGQKKFCTPSPSCRFRGMRGVSAAFP